MACNMDAKTSSSERAVSFLKPDVFLAGLDAAAIADVVSSASDLALVVEAGVVKDVAIANADLAAEGIDTAWLGKPWIETVTPESRPKIEDLLAPDAGALARWRHVNHPIRGPHDLPIRYTTVQAGPGDRVVALGRDLRADSALQQRLIEAHQRLERDYSRLREAEARYRLLFETSREPILIVDAASLAIEDANPAASEALGRDVDALSGALFSDLYDEGSARAVERAVAEALAVGATTVERLSIAGGRETSVSMSAFRQDNAERLIVRFERAGDVDPSGAQPRIVEALEQIPDGLLVAGSDLRILAANGAFAEMAHLSSRNQAIGARLADFIGRSATDLNVLISNLRNHGVLRNFTTILRDRFGAEESVEVSAVAAPSDDGLTFGLSIRNVARRLQTGRDLGGELPRSVDQLTNLVGRAPLKEIVRESTDLIEKLCIEAALEITADNRASAAEMLGLSRQGLYSKLKRFGIDDKA